MDASALAAVLAWGALKGALLLAAAGLATVALRDASAAARHAVWAVALSAALVLPVLDAVGPAWRLAVLPAVPEAGSSAAVVAAPAGAPWVAGALLLTWLLGLLVVSWRWFASAAAARRLVASSTPLGDVVWAREAQRVSGDMDLRRHVEIRESDALRSPVAWGVRRPVLLLPSEAREWSAERRMAVLTHELSHVRRRDCLTGIVAEAACALHWFNPLAWLAYRRLHVERERACDDGVLRGGLRASHYASHLLSVARDAGAHEPAAPRLAPALARRSEIEERIRAMLDGRPRTGPLSRGAVSALGMTALVAAGLIGAVEPVRRAATPGPVRAAVPVSELAAVAVLPGVPAIAATAAVAPVAPAAPVRRTRATARQTPSPPPPPPPAPPEPPPAPRADVAWVQSPPPAAARVLTWRAPSGPAASDEPWRVARVVRVIGADGPIHYTVVLPELPPSVWHERSDEVMAQIERSIARQVHLSAAAPRALGVRADRFVVAVRRRGGATSVDSAAHRGYRADREEEAAPTKAGT